MITLCLAVGVIQWINISNNKRQDQLKQVTFEPGVLLLKARWEGGGWLVGGGERENFSVMVIWNGHKEWGYVRWAVHKNSYISLLYLYLYATSVCIFTKVLIQKERLCTLKCVSSTYAVYLG